jgi:hypothetical protein
MEKEEEGTLEINLKELILYQELFYREIKRKEGKEGR